MRIEKVRLPQAVSQPSTSEELRSAVGHNRVGEGGGGGRKPEYSPFDIFFPGILAVVVISCSQK